VPYFEGTEKSDHRRGFGFLSLPIIIVVIVVEIKRLRFRVISGDDRICSHGWQNVYHVISPFVGVGVSELRNVAPPGFVKGGFGGRHCEIVVLSFSVVFSIVATVMRFRVLEALLKVMKEILEKIVRFLDSSDSLAHNLLKLWCFRSLNVSYLRGPQGQYIWECKYGWMPSARIRVNSHLRPYKTSPSPAIWYITVCGHTRHHRLQPYMTSPRQPNKTSPLQPYETHLRLRPVYATPWILEETKRGDKHVKEHLVNCISYINNILVKVKLMEWIELKVG